MKHQVLSPAKINLMLRVLNQRPDGYHNIQTCFQLLNWGDQICFTPINSNVPNSIEISGFQGIALEDNLMFKAAEQLKPYAQNTSSYQLSVSKSIPMGAGLGGGSSNAAATLTFLNKHWACNLTLAELQRIAVTLGADVPVFLFKQSALATGIGEELVSVQFDTPYVLLLFPECAISTRDLFCSADLSRNQTPLKQSYWQDNSFWINDFFPLVLKQYPAVKNLYEQLSPMLPLRLSGTGSTLFSVFDDLAAAEEALKHANQFCQTVLTQPL